MSWPPTRNLVRLDLQPLKFRPSAVPSPCLTHLSQERDKVLRAPPGIPIHRLPVVIIRGRWARVHHDCRRFSIIHPGSAWVEINQTTGACTQGRGDMRRTVDAASTSETLPGGYNRRAATKRCAWLCNMRTGGARAGHEVA